MVLVDSSHEAQEQVLTGELPWLTRAAMRLVIPAAMVKPRNALRRRGPALAISEDRALYRLAEGDRPVAAGGLGGRPMIVITACTLQGPPGNAGHSERRRENSATRQPGRLSYVPKSADGPRGAASCLQTRDRHRPQARDERGGHSGGVPTRDRAADRRRGQRQKEVRYAAS
jgi:hypothetical protein